MAVNTTLAGLSTDPALNGPIGTIDPPSSIDDSLRYSLSFTAQLRDAATQKSTDLADKTNPSLGAALIGWVRNATVAVGHKLSQWLDWQPTDFFEFMTDAQIADVQAGTGLLDVTLAMRAAINSGAKTIVMSPGGYFITDQLTLQTGQTVTGENPETTYFILKKTPGLNTPIFNVAATSVVQLGTAEPGAKMVGVGFKCEQPDQNVRANCIQYPWLIDISNQPRSYVDQIKAYGAWNGIKMLGNCGGAYVGDIDIGALNVGIDIDGPLDFVNGGIWHFWPFGISASPLLMAVYTDGTTIGARIGVSDGHSIESLQGFRVKHVIKSNATVEIPIQVSTLKLDGDGSRIEVLGGLVQVGTSYSTESSLSVLPAFDVSAGTCIIGNHSTSSNSSSNLFHTSGTGKLIVQNGYVKHVNPASSIGKTDGGVLSIDNLRIANDPGTAFTQANFKQVTGSMQINNCTWEIKGAGSGNAIEYASDNNQNSCDGNDFGAWSYAPPAATDLGKYGGNNFNLSNQDYIGGFLVSAPKYKQFKVTTDGAGAYTGAHGIGACQQKIISMSVQVKGSSAEATNSYTTVYADGTNFNVAGAPANRRIRVTIGYTETTDAW